MSVERIDLKTDDGVLDLYVFTPEAGYPLTEGDTGLPLNDAVLIELILAP